MPSTSLTAGARSQYLLDLLAQLPDPRKRRGRRHPLAGLGAAVITVGALHTQGDTAQAITGRPAGPQPRSWRVTW